MRHFVLKFEHFKQSLRAKNNLRRKLGGEIPEKNLTMMDSQFQ